MPCRPGVVVLDDAGSVVQINPAAAGRSWVRPSRRKLDGDLWRYLVPGETPGEFLAGARHLAVDVTPLD
jgi:hypothetical protein